VVPEKQGLKPSFFRFFFFDTWSLSSGSRKTRIETAVETRKSIDIGLSKQWFQKNKDWNTSTLPAPFVPNPSLSSGSRKTRIETSEIVEIRLNQFCLSSGSRKTRIETVYYLPEGFHGTPSKQWFQKNKDWNSFTSRLTSKYSFV